MEEKIWGVTNDMYFSYCNIAFGKFLNVFIHTFIWMKFDVLE